MKLIDKLSHKIGLTVTEIKVIVFLFVILLIGYSVKIYNSFSSEKGNDYDYALQDSLFMYANIEDEELVQSDSVKSEILGFNKTTTPTGKKNIEIKEKSINLNTASKEELSMLPGIGVKTAENIILFRKKAGKFNNINELMNISRIGPARFEKLKKYIFVK